MNEFVIVGSVNTLIFMMGCFFLFLPVMLSW